MTTSDHPNHLYFGDNLDILRQRIADESVDLIYLDPPFNSNATYNVLFRERSGEESAAQITAFDDTWRWSMESELAYQDVIANGPDKPGQLLAAMRAFLGQNDMMAYPKTARCWKSHSWQSGCSAWRCQSSGTSTSDHIAR